MWRYQLSEHSCLRKSGKKEASVLCYFIDYTPFHPSDERLTAEEMDEQRRQNVAYQYLCRLEEAKR